MGLRLVLGCGRHPAASLDCRLHPGTRLHDERDKYGLVFEEKDGLPLVVRTPWLEEGDYKQMQRIAKALRMTENRHPTTIKDLLHVAEGN